jgi:hypothetical protein
LIEAEADAPLAFWRRIHQRAAAATNKMPAATGIKILSFMSNIIKLLGIGLALAKVASPGEFSLQVPHFESFAARGKE